MSEAKVPDGLIVMTFAATPILASATGIDSKILLSELLLMMKPPVPFAIFSEQVITRLSLSPTPVALSAGDKVIVQSGGVKSQVVKFQVVLFKIPAKALPARSSITPAAILT